MDDRRKEADLPFPQGGLDRLAYIAGTARGGTTLLQRLVCLHPEIGGVPKPTHFMDHIWAHRDLPAKVLLRIYQSYRYFDRRAVLDALSDEQKEALQAVTDRALQGDDLPRMWQLFPIYYGLNPKLDQDPSQVRCWTDKETHAEHLETVARSVPESRFILIVRDPRAATLSIAKRRSVDIVTSSEIALQDDHLVQACLYWRDTVQRALRFADRRPERAHLVRFEDLLQEPVGTMQGVYGFLGTGTLTDAELEKRMASVGYGATNDPEEAGTGISTKPLNRWRNTLTPKHLGIIARLTQDTAAKVGYDLEEHEPLGRFGVLDRLPSGTAQPKALAKWMILGGREPFVPGAPVPRT